MISKPEFWIRALSYFGEWDYLGMDGTTRRFIPGTAEWNRTKKFSGAREAVKFAESNLETPWKVVKAIHQGPGKVWKEIPVALSIHRRGWQSGMKGGEQ